MTRVFTIVVLFFFTCFACFSESGAGAAELPVGNGAESFPVLQDSGGVRGADKGVGDVIDNSALPGGNVDISIGAVEDFQSFGWSPEEVILEPDIFSTDWIKSRFVLSGYLKNETGFRINGPAAFTKILNIMQLEPRFAITPSLGIYLRSYQYFDLVHYFENIDTVSVRRGPRSLLPTLLTPTEIDRLNVTNIRDVDVKRYDSELREYYLDYSSTYFDMRIGRQIVRWGVVEGARVNDTINPLDFAEMILRDVDDRYIPLKMIKTDFYFGDTNLEALFIPELTFHQPAPKGSQWQQLEFFAGRQTPPETLSNAEYGLKLTQFIGSLSIAASYFYTWDDFPTSFRTINRSADLGGSTDVTITQGYTRIRATGLTVSGELFSNPVGFEVAYLTGKQFGTRLDATGDGVRNVSGGAAERTYLKYAAGIDFLLFGADSSIQFIQQMIPNYDESLNLIPDRFETIWAFSTRKKMFYQSLFPSLLIIYFQNDSDILFRPKLDISVGEKTLISVGADIFEGKISDSNNGVLLPGEFHFVGFFDNNDRVYMNIKYLL